MATSKGGYVSGGFDILKAPNAPTITSVTTNIGSATVAFTAPADVGGGAITSYTITAVDESTGASTGATGSASPITISPPAGGTFKIRAAATNIYGPGRVSQYDTGNQIYSGASLWAWGYNGSGAVGDNTVINRSSPVQVGALTNWAQVSSGNAHSEAIKADGTLWAWGSNGSGRLGDSTTANKSSPVQIGALTNWAQVSAGREHTVATKTDGTLWTWGKNNTGQLGDNTIVNKSSPVQIGTLTNWVKVSAGFYTTLALTSSGNLWSWGYNGSGQLGDNTIANKSSPVQVGALTNWASITNGISSFSVKTDGTLWSWGYNGRGQLGQNNTIKRSSPVQVGALTNWAQISTSNGNSHFSATKTDGTLWACGYNGSGQLGDGTTANKSSPVQIGALTNWAQVSAGGDFTSSTKTDGTLWSWGINSSGQLGLNISYLVKRSSPVQVGALTSWVQVSAGGTQAAALYGVV